MIDLSPNSLGKSYVKSVVASEEIWCLGLLSKIVKIIAIYVPSWKNLFYSFKESFEFDIRAMG